MPIAVTRDRAGKMKHTVTVRQHSFAVDEPESNGGEDAGPTPHELYDCALGACKAMTTLWYANRKQIPVEDIEVSLDPCAQHSGGAIEGHEMDEPRLVSRRDECARHHHRHVGRRVPALDQIAPSLRQKVSLGGRGLLVRRGLVRSGKELRERDLLSVNLRARVDESGEPHSEARSARRNAKRDHHRARRRRHRSVTSSRRAG